VATIASSDVVVAAPRCGSRNLTTGARAAPRRPVAREVSLAATIAVGTPRAASPSPTSGVVRGDGDDRPKCVPDADQSSCACGTNAEITNRVGETSNAGQFVTGTLHGLGWASVITTPPRTERCATHRRSSRPRGRA
jgi:hypothetical protein